MRSVCLVIGILSILALTGCETGYQDASESLTGGYGSEREDKNLYGIWYAGNTLVTEEKSADMALMRAAEIALENGFNYMAVVGEETKTINNWANTVKVCAFFRKDPKHLHTVHDCYKAEEIFREMARKYTIVKDKKIIEPKRGKFKPEPDLIKFEMDPYFDEEPIPVENIKLVNTGIQSFETEGMKVGRFIAIENPVETIEDFIEVAKPIAAKHGANGIVIEDNPAEIHANAAYSDIKSKLIGFAADLYFLPSVSLGIEWEPGDLMLGKYIIRRFRDGSNAPDVGLKIGDKILAINEVDVLDLRRLIQEYKKWSAGETATLTIVREGMEKKIEVPLVPNL
jgi:hypothetical protein